MDIVRVRVLAKNESTIRTLIGTSVLEHWSYQRL